MFTPIAAHFLRRRGDELARSALPHAPVLPYRRPRPEPVGAARRRAANALRRSADVLAPSSQVR